jgi:hypothetical protein
MRTALTAFSCMAAYWVIVITGNADDASRPVLILAYGLVAASFVLGLAGVAIAFGGRVPDRRRGLVLMLSALPVLVAVGLGVFILLLVTTRFD